MTYLATSDPESFVVTYNDPEQHIWGVILPCVKDQLLFNGSSCVTF